MTTPNTKTAAAVVAALALAAATLTSFTSEAQAGRRSGLGLGLGLLATGAMIGAATSGGYGAPAYVVEPGYPSCRYVDRYNAFGAYVGTVKICDVY